MLCKITLGGFQTAARVLRVAELLCPRGMRKLNGADDRRKLFHDLCNGSKALTRIQARITACKGERFDITAIGNQLGGVIQMHEVEPFPGKAIQLRKLRSGTVEMKHIDHHSDIFETLCLQYLFNTLNIPHRGPGDKFQIDIQTVFAGQLSHLCKLIHVAGLVVCPNAAQKALGPELRADLHGRLVLADVNVVSNSGKLDIVNMDGMFDVGMMFFFGILGFILRRREFSVAPVTLGLVLGGMMDSNFRRAVSLASTASNPVSALFGRPITIALLLVTILTLVGNIPTVKGLKARRAAKRA